MIMIMMMMMIMIMIIIIIFKDDFQSVLHTLKSLFVFFVLFRVRCHKM